MHVGRALTSIQYAGVPITTSRGISIGAFCVLDDKTRPQGLNKEEIRFLRDMATTTMTHLEMVTMHVIHVRNEGSQTFRYALESRINGVAI